MGVLRVKVNGQWVDVGAAPSAGGVYGINHYHGILAANTTITAANQFPISIAMPAAPAGSLLDISFVVYVNQSVVGTGSTFLFVQVNGVTNGPTLVVGDRIQLESYAWRCVSIAQPVGVAYNITFGMVKAAGGGTIVAQGTNTCLDVVSYRP